MSRLRRVVVFALALSAALLSVVVPAQTANAAPGLVNKIIVWGDSLTLAWPDRYFEPLVGAGVDVEPRGVGSDDVQATQARFNQWYNSATPMQRNNTGHICWCGHVNANPDHEGTPQDTRSVVPTLEAMRARVPGLFMAIGLTNGPLIPEGSEPYREQINDGVAGNGAVNEQMAASFGSLYTELRGFLVGQGLQVAGITPTQRDQANLAVDVVPYSLRRDDVDPDTDPHFNEVGKSVLSVHLNDRVRQVNWVVGDQKPVPTTVVTSSLNPSRSGQSVYFNATVTNPGPGPKPTGYVQFLLDGKQLGGVRLLNQSTGSVRSVARTNLAVGERIISVQYLGDVNFRPSQDAVNQIVNGGGPPGQLQTTTTAVSNPGSPTPYGTRFRVIATVTNVQGQTGATPTGTVQFMIDGKNAGRPMTLNAQGQAGSIQSSARLARGNHIVRVTYSGDSTHQPSSYTYTHVVT